MAQGLGFRAKDLEFRASKIGGALLGFPTKRIMI